MNRRQTPARAPWRAGLLVLAAHALLAGALWQGLRTGWAPRRPTPAPVPLWLRWVPVGQPSVPEPAAQPAPGPPVRRPMPRPAPPPAEAAIQQAAPAAPNPPADRPTQAITAPPTGLTGAASAASETTPPAAQSATPPVAQWAARPAASAPAAPPPPLNLALPARHGHPPPATAARDDLAVNTPSASRDERLAIALGTDARLRIERHGERLRFQQGRDCVDVRPARMSQLDPFNESTHPTPRQAEPCRP